MPILNRLTSLVFADVHAVLDKLEDPHASLGLAVREMETSLHGSSKEIDVLKSSIEHRKRRHAEFTRRVAVFADELDVCFSSNKEALAKIVLRKKLNGEQVLLGIEKSLTELDSGLQREEALFRENERRLSAMREKLALHGEEFNGPSADTEAFSAVSDSVTEEAVEVAFLKELQRRKPQ